ncbi:GNAT family N-acetyltransferase [Pseudomonas panipatensis]|jgi:ribosomal protein S18 acetylase RimI-like enzyme|uniref:Acetyltransferase (GNAT) family protein n=1 Tax=Pseudomonas panipatensis TaxID=428992 RepID=A0A1G8IHI1_9PSED|nr:GNAT family N-acetyltransferase [Pseudomonas panipatensis]SDI18353.1 Acetyltransferase (GNAT) family protein [Pseudomonas panipatensis]SMP73960.1 Acetyltransferase (GNAT) family protein [Pseudomonas panipatensis]
MTHAAHPSGLGMRPARAGDEAFLEALYRDARPELQLVDGDGDFVEALVQQQYQVQNEGIGRHFPNAMRHVIERIDTRIGALVTDVGAVEIRILYLAFIPEARGLGYGSTILRGLQQAAEQARCPLATVVWASNPGARRHYLALGFEVESYDVAAERLVWYPPALRRVLS